MPPDSAEITAALDGLADGTRAALLIELHPGTRTSAAFHQLRAAAAAAGCTVVTVPAAESDQLSTRTRLLEALARPGDPGGDPGGGPTADSGAIADRVAELLDAHSHAAPVVVVLEDAAWTDPGTLQVLRTVPERVGHLPILWAVGVLSGASRADRAVAALDRLGAVTVPAGTQGPPDGTPDPVALLQVGAVIGIEFEVELAARVLGRPVGSLLDEIGDALAGGVLLDGGPVLRFADARTRADLYAALPESVRRALHHEVARQQTALPGAETAAVWHLSRSTGRLGDADLAVVRGTVARLAAVAPEEAAELAFRVSDLFVPPDPRHVEFVITAAAHLGRTSRVAEALSVLEHLAVSGLSNREEARLRLVVAQLHQAAGDDNAAMEHAARALALPALDAHVELALLKIKSAGHVNLGEIDAAIRVSRPILDTARTSPDPATRVSADLFASQLAFGQAQVTPALQLAEQAAAGVEVSATRPLHAPRIPELWLATVLLSSDRAAEAAELLLDGQRHYERRGLGWSAPYWHTIRAVERWMCGDLDDAAAEAETALDAAERLEIVRTRQLSRSVLAIVEADRGRAAHAARALGEAPLPRRPGAYDMWTAAALVRTRSDRADEAHRWLDRHANLARLMTLPPAMWPGLVVPHGPHRTLRQLLIEAGRNAHDQQVVRAAVAAASTGPPIPHLLRSERATSGWDSLTASELRVAELVAQGRTNRAIAEQLHVSVHTVGTHLRHAFTKLDINTRVELTRMALLHRSNVVDR
jgi:DNA-binding CsgD family transcriptional regulator